MSPSRPLRSGAATIVAGLALFAATPAAATLSDESATRVEPAESLAPHLLLIHGGGFIYEDPNFEALTRGPAEAAGFVPHYLRYPTGDLPAAVRAAREAARRLDERHIAPVYVYGSSAGGTLAALLAGDGLARAAVAKAPPSDLLGWSWPLTRYGADYFERIGVGPESRRRLSPLRRPARRPLLVVHGVRDAVVPLAMSEAFAVKFKRVHLWALGGGHHLERVRPSVLERSLRWLARLDERSRQPRPERREGSEQRR